MNRRTPQVEYRGRPNSRTPTKPPPSPEPSTESLFLEHKGERVTCRFKHAVTTGTLVDVNKTFLVMADCEILLLNQDNETVSQEKWKRVLLNWHSLPILAVGTE